jgi:hypothetical protein
VLNGVRKLQDRRLAVIQEIPERRGWTRLALVGLAVVVVATVIGLRLAAGGGGSGPAALVAAAPSDGAELAAPPAAVSLTFSAAVDAGATHILVVGPDGTSLVTGDPVVRGGTITQPVEIAAATGRVLVAYHATLRDGREVSGQQQFAVGAAAPGPGVPGSAGAPGAAVPGVSPPPTAEVALPADPASGVASHDHGAIGPLAAVAALVIVAGGAAVLTMAVRRP